MNVLCVGDSIVAGYHNVWGPGRRNDESDICFHPLTVPLRTFIAPQMTYADFRRANNTIEFSGWTLAEMRITILTLAIAHTPRYLVVSAGINDLINAHSDGKQLATDAILLLELARKHVGQLVVWVLPPIGRLRDGPRGPDDERGARQRAIGQLCVFRAEMRARIADKGLGYACIDAHELSLDDCVNLDRQGMAGLAAQLAGLIYVHENTHALCATARVAATLP
jgi:hypothetical protein